ncbi:MAG: recombinase family protein [Ignavibacteriales bacterium]|nr:recombinase family protein [Ignavibacteriales bacterium]
MENEKHVGIWIRVSTEDQVKGESPEHHEKRARYYAESKDWIVKDVYRLEAVSGKSVMEHPETKRMLADVRSHKITGIIFSKLARLARNTKELLDFADIFRECDADLVSLQESIDTSTPAGRLFYTMIAAMAQWEREEIAERVAASVPIRAKLGKPLGGAAPFGYQWVDKRLVIDPKEAPIRKRVYELFLEHRRKRTVARLLNESGYRTRNGGQFSDTTVDRLLRDPIAKGKRRMNYTRSLGQNKKWVVKPEDEWVHINIEPIVSDEVWGQCNQILGEQHQRQNRRPAEHLFTGIVFCSCNNKMYVPHKSSKYTCYKCHNKIPTSDLEVIYHEQLKTFFFSNEEISTYLNKADELINDRQNLFVSIEEEAKKLKHEMDKLVRLHLDGEMPKEGFGNHYRPLEDRLKQIQNQLPELQGEIDYLKIQYLSSDEVLTEAKDLYERWPTLELVEKRNIIDTITKRITVGSDEVSINLSYMPSSAEMTAGMQYNLRDSWHKPS